MEGKDNMTPGEIKHVDEQFKSLKDLFIEKIENLKESFQAFINTSLKDSEIQRQDIVRLYDKTNENKEEIIKLKGKVEKIEDIKKAEEGTKDRGIKMWQFWLAFSIPTIMSIIGLTITIINSLP